MKEKYFLRAVCYDNTYGNWEPASGEEYRSKQAERLYNLIKDIAGDRYYEEIDEEKNIKTLIPYEEGNSYVSISLMPIEYRSRKITAVDFLNAFEDLLNDVED